MAYLKYNGRLLVAPRRRDGVPYTQVVGCEERPDGFIPPEGEADGLTLVKYMGEYMWLQLPEDFEIPECAGPGRVITIDYEGDFWPELPDDPEPEEPWTGRRLDPDTDGVVVSEPSDNAWFSVWDIRHTWLRRYYDYADGGRKQFYNYAPGVGDSSSRSEYGDYYEYWPEYAGDYYVDPSPVNGLAGALVFTRGDGKYMSLLQWHDGMQWWEAEDCYLEWHADVGSPAWCLFTTDDLINFVSGVRQSGLRPISNDNPTLTKLSLLRGPVCPYDPKGSHESGGKTRGHTLQRMTVNGNMSLVHAVGEPAAEQVYPVYTEAFRSNLVNQEGRRYPSRLGTSEWLKRHDDSSTAEVYTRRLCHKYEEFEYPSVVQEITASYAPIGSPVDMYGKAKDWHFSNDFEFLAVGHKLDVYTAAYQVIELKGSLIRIRQTGAQVDGAGYSIDGGKTWVPIGEYALVRMTWEDLRLAIYNGMNNLPQQDGFVYTDGQGVYKFVSIKFLPVAGYATPEDIGEFVKYGEIKSVTPRTGYVPE